MTNEEALEQIKALEQQCHKYTQTWEIFREQRDRARARIADLQNKLREASADAHSWCTQCDDRVKDLLDLKERYDAVRAELLEVENLLRDMMGANYYPSPIINRHGQTDPQSYVYANAAMYFATKEEARLLLSEKNT